MQRYEPTVFEVFGEEVLEMEYDSNGGYVDYSDAEILINTLRKIANEDYRGNRPQSAVDAYNALKKLNLVD